jgi:hypothetical protein
MKTLVQRFESHFITEPNSGCWIWIGATTQSSAFRYGAFILPGETKYAHRAAWLLYRGSIPKGLCCLHKCDFPTCVNPEHLFLGTQKENSEDMVAKNRVQRGERHYRAVLKESDVLEILKDTRSAATIANRFGVHAMTVGKIKRKVNWKHVQKHISL